MKRFKRILLVVLVLCITLGTLFFATACTKKIDYTITLTCPDTTVLDRILVRLNTENGKKAAEKPLTDGKATFKLSPATYSVQILGATNYTYSPASLTKDSPTATIHLTQSEEHQKITYTVTVQFPDREPADGVFVRLCKADTKDTYETQQTNAQGIATFKLLPAVYEVHIPNPPQGYTFDNQAYTVTADSPSAIVKLKVEEEKSKTFTVTYVDGTDDEEIVVPIDNNEYKQGDRVTVLAEIKRDGYNFIGWSDGVNSYYPDETFDMPSHNVILTAMWKLIEDDEIQLPTDLNGTWSCIHEGVRIVLAFDGTKVTLDLGPDSTSNGEVTAYDQETKTLIISFEAENKEIPVVCRLIYDAEAKTLTGNPINENSTIEVVFSKGLVDPPPQLTIEEHFFGTWHDAARKHIIIVSANDITVNNDAVIDLESDNANGYQFIWDGKTCRIFYKKKAKSSSLRAATTSLNRFIKRVTIRMQKSAPKAIPKRSSKRILSKNGKYPSHLVPISSRSLLRRTRLIPSRRISTSSSS